MPPPRPKGEKERIAMRRQFVMEQRARGFTVNQIHEKWNAANPDFVAGNGTIANDVITSLKQLADASQMHASAVRELLVMRLDRAMSSEKFQKQIDNGNLLAIDRLIKMVERYAKLYGADAPTKIAQTDISGEKEIAGLSDDERAARIFELIERAKQRQLDIEEGEWIEEAPPQIAEVSEGEVIVSE